jgi:hypothetical protein
VVDTFLVALTDDDLAEGGGESSMGRMGCEAREAAD